jgi:hypothetical protein
MRDERWNHKVHVWQALLPSGLHDQHRGDQKHILHLRPEALQAARDASDVQLPLKM